MTPSPILTLLTSAKTLFPNKVTSSNPRHHLYIQPVLCPRSDPNLIPQTPGTWHRPGPASGCPPALQPLGPQPVLGATFGCVQECACLCCVQILFFTWRGERGILGFSRAHRGLSARKCSFLSYWQPFDLAGAQLAGSAAKEPWRGRGGKGEGQADPSSGSGPGSWANDGPPCWLAPAHPTPLWLLLLLGLLSSPSHKGEFWRPSTTLPSQEEDVQRRSSSWQGKNCRAMAISGPCPLALRSPGYSWRAPLDSLDSSQHLDPLSSAHAMF